MKVLIKSVDQPMDEIPEKTLELSRVPTLGEYVRTESDWYQVKRVVHHAGESDVAAELYAISIVDPTREPLRLSEWLEPGV